MSAGRGGRAGGGSGSMLSMSISKVPNMDEQLRMLRESVRKGREQARPPVGGYASGAAPMTASTAAGPTTAGTRAGTGAGAGGELRKKSSLRNRLPTGGAQVGAVSPQTKGAAAAAAARPPSRECAETIERIAAFDLFGGAVDVNALSTEEEGKGKAAYTDVDIEKLRSTYQEEFREIDNYRYDEEEEKRLFAKRHPQAAAAQSVVPPQAQAQTPTQTAAATPKKRVSISSTVSTSSHPQHPTPPKGSVRRGGPNAGVTSPPRVARLHDTSLASTGAARDGKRAGGVWDAYSIDARPGETLSQFKKNKRTGKPIPAAAAATPQRQKVAASPAAPKDRAVAARMAELTQFLCTPPPTGGDVDGHQLKQREALQELQRLQNGGSAPAGKTASAAATTTTTSEKTVRIVRTSDAADHGGGGSLFQGEFNEAQNQREFQEALNEWRSGGKKKEPSQQQAPPAKAQPTTTSTSIGDNAPLPAAQRSPFAMLKDEFLSELESANEYVYFHQLMFQ